MMAQALYDNQCPQKVWTKFRHSNYNFLIVVPHILCAPDVQIPVSYTHLNMLESLLKNTGTILMEQMYHSQFIIVNHCTTKTQEKELRKLIQSYSCLLYTSRCV